jgi:hypothetical protein
VCAVYKKNFGNVLIPRWYSQEFIPDISDGLSSLVDSNDDESNDMLNNTITFVQILSCKQDDETEGSVICPNVTVAARIEYI